MRDYTPADIMYAVDVDYDGGSYSNPHFKIVLHDAVKTHLSIVARKVKSYYNGNVLLVNRWLPEIETK